MKDLTTTIDIDPTRARLGQRLWYLIIFWAALILVGSWFEDVPRWAILLMALMFLLGNLANDAAFVSRTGTSQREAVAAFETLRGGSKKPGYIELSPDLTTQYANGQRLRILEGYDHWLGPVTQTQRFAAEGDEVVVRSDSSKSQEVYVVTDDGAHITVPKRFLEKAD